MRIIHVNLAKGFRGGERQTVILIQALEALEALGVEQSLVCRKGSPMIAELVGSACQIQAVNRPLLSAFIFKGLTSPGQALVHAHEAKASQWAFLFRLIRKVPYIITRRIQKRPSNSVLTKLVYQSADAVVAISTSVARTMSLYLQSVHSRSTEFPVIPDASAQFSVSSSNCPLRELFPDKYIIGHIGALSIAEKGQDLIIQAARLLEDELPEVQFVLIGEGKDRAELESLSDDLSNIELMGFREDIGESLSAMDTFVFPSRHEGLGSSLLDALSFQLPIVAADIPGITDIIRDRENGLLIPKGNPESLAKAITELYKNKPLRDSLRANTLVSLQPFLPVEIASSYVGLYKSTLESSSQIT